MESCIYRGSLRHRRYEPVVHRFSYPVFMMFLNLEEIASVFAGRWLWSDSRPALARFRRRDHLGENETPLADSVRALVETRSGTRPEGPVMLLTHLGYFGYRFNPVSFYYCYDRAGGGIRAIVAEINNTPWGEQHCYVLANDEKTSDRRSFRYRLRKDFHISPFMEMDMDYDWRFHGPGDRLAVHMKNLNEGRTIFDATLALRREPINTWSLNKQLVLYPAMTARVIGRIYWQALRLWLKGCPYVPHPTATTTSEEVRIP